MQLTHVFFKLNVSDNTESQHPQAATENIHFDEILKTKRTQRIRDLLSMCYINLHFAYLLVPLLIDIFQSLYVHACYQFSRTDNEEEIPTYVWWPLTQDLCIASTMYLRNS